MAKLVAKVNPYQYMTMTVKVSRVATFRMKVFMHLLRMVMWIAPFKISVESD